MAYLGIGIVVFFIAVIFLIRDYSAIPFRLDAGAPPRKPHNMFEHDLPDYLQVPTCSQEDHFFSTYQSGFKCRCGKMELRRESDGLYVRDAVELGWSGPLQKGESV